MINFKTKIRTPKIKPYVSINEIEIDIENIEPGSITLEQYENVRANSPGFRLLYSKLNNEALITAVKHNLNNCRYTYKSEATYEWALENVLVPELIKRLEDNAQLTAAAPDLLEACKKAYQFITNGRELGYIQMPDGDSGDTALETPDILREAIVKAIGK